MPQYHTVGPGNPPMRAHARSATIGSEDKVTMSRRTLTGLVAAFACAALLGGTASAGGSGQGPSWRVFATHVPDLYAVDARSGSDVWAVGEGVVHWDGRTLKVSTLPWKGTQLYGVSAVSRSDVWAIGRSEEVYGPLV